MNALESVAAHCPYCGEPIELLVDCASGAQRYVEDCPVCCRPIEVAARPAAGNGPMLRLQRQDDA